MSTLKPVRVEEPEVYVRQVCRWAKRNPRLFKLCMRIIHREVDRGNPCVQRGHMYKLAQEAGIPITDCDEIRRNHNFWAILTRYWVMLRPRLARSLNFRKAGCDDVDLKAIWREEVNAGTTFLADNWQAAKRACEMDSAEAA